RTAIRADPRLAVGGTQLQPELARRIQEAGRRRGFPWEHERARHQLTDHRDEIGIHRIQRKVSEAYDQSLHLPPLSSIAKGIAEPSRLILLPNEKFERWLARHPEYQDWEKKRTGGGSEPRLNEGERALVRFVKDRHLDAKALVPILASMNDLPRRVA